MKREKRCVIHVECEPKLKRKLERLAKAQRRSVSEVVRMLVEEA